MKTKLLFLILLISSSVLFSQSIGFLGDFSGWGDDVDMDTADNITYTKTNYYLPNTGLKFRQDDDWTNNWGGDTFPSGSSTGNNIPVTAGFYDISFDRVAGTYSFTSVAGANQNVSVIGDFNSWAADLVLTTSDNLNYTATNVALTTGGLKFRRDASWSTNFGSASLSGTATPGGANIPIPADSTYDLRFNIETLVFSVDDVLSVDEFSRTLVDLFANADVIYINGLKSNEDYTISIFDTMGRQIKNLTSNSGQIDISTLKTAVYFVTLETSEGNIIRKKIIKQ